MGGLSIFDGIHRVLPEARYIYVSDHEFAPYGARRDDELRVRVPHLVSRFISLKPDLMVLACNTASTLLLPILRSALAIPVVGVVPAIKPAAALSETKVIGLLATPSTIQREYTEGLIRTFAPDVHVVRVGSVGLVALAEAKMRGEVILNADIAAELEAFHKDPRGPEIDVIVLGCTHFPLLRTELAAEFGRAVIWLDSAEAIAKRVLSLLSEHKSKAPIIHENRAYVTQAKPVSEGLAKAFHDRGFGMVSAFQMADCQIVPSPL